MVIPVWIGDVEKDESHTREVLPSGRILLQSHNFWDPDGSAAPISMSGVTMLQASQASVVCRWSPSSFEESSHALRAQVLLSCAMWFPLSKPQRDTLSCQFLHPCVRCSDDIWHRESDAFVSSWSVSRKTMNKMRHAIMGNGGGNKGKGKGRMSVQVDPEIEFARTMREALPEAAKTRAQPKLLQEHWNQTIREWKHPDSTGGIAIAPKEAFLERVGYSSKPVAILVVQEPDDIGMMAYPRSRARCTYDVASTRGLRKHVEVDRWLVQLGFAEHVAMKPAGEEVKVGFTMIRMVAKLSPWRGWSHGPHPGGVLTNHLKQFVDERAFDAVVPREDGSFLFLVHNVLEETCFPKAGSRAFFLGGTVQNQKRDMSFFGLTLRSALTMPCLLRRTQGLWEWWRKETRVGWLYVFAVLRTSLPLLSLTSTTSMLVCRGGRLRGCHYRQEFKVSPKCCARWVGRLPRSRSLSVFGTAHFVWRWKRW